MEKSEFIEYFTTHSNASTIKYFNISYDYFYQILVDFGLEKHSRKENIKLTNIEKYGSETLPDEVRKSIVNKRIQTCVEKYGVENAMQVENVKEKIREHFRKSDDSVRVQKIKQTKLERYGDENYCNVEKAKETNLQRYGVENASQLESTKEKIKETCLQKYGVEYTGQIPEKIEKTKQTILNNWGPDNYCNREKAKQTNRELFGHDYAMQNDDVKEHASNMVQSKYGVPWNCMRKEARIKGNNSQPNQVFATKLDLNNIEYEREFTLERYSYDFKVGDSTLIEINPTITHNSSKRFYDRPMLNSSYHKQKNECAYQNGFRCLCVWDWDNQEKIINLLQDKETIYGRNCFVEEITKEESAQFINKYHLQGYVNDEIRIALKYHNEIVSIMTFGKPRYNKKYEYELIRYCSAYNILGGASKLFSYFIKKYSPCSIISYCDRSKFTGETYYKLGFKLLKSNAPSKHWYNISTGQHITDNLLRQRGFDQLFNTNYGKGVSNECLMLNAGFLEVYDCGQDTFIWEKINTI